MSRRRIALLRWLRGPSLARMRANVRRSLKQRAEDGINTNWYFQGNAK